MHMLCVLVTSRVTAAGHVKYGQAKLVLAAAPEKL